MISPRISCPLPRLSGAVEPDTVGVDLVNRLQIREDTARADLQAANSRREELWNSPLRKKINLGQYTNDKGEICYGALYRPPGRWWSASGLLGSGLIVLGLFPSALYHAPLWTAAVLCGAGLGACVVSGIMARSVNKKHQAAVSKLFNGLQEADRNIAASQATLEAVAPELYLARMGSRLNQPPLPAGKIEKQDDGTLRIGDVLIRSSGSQG